MHSPILAHFQVRVPTSLDIFLDPYNLPTLNITFYLKYVFTNCLLDLEKIIFLQINSFLNKVFLSVAKKFKKMFLQIFDRS